MVLFSFVRGLFVPLSLTLPAFLGGTHHAILNALFVGKFLYCANFASLKSTSDLFSRHRSVWSSTLDGPLERREIKPPRSNKHPATATLNTHFVCAITPQRI